MQDLGEVAQAVSRVDYKRAVHILDDDSDDDLLFDGLLQAAQAVVETAARRLMVPRSVAFDARAVGAGRWWFPVAPVSEVTAIEWRAGDGWAALDLAGVRLEQGHGEPQLVFADGFFAGVDDGAELRIVATAGHGVMDRPKTLAQAVIMLTKDWFEAGIALDQPDYQKVSFGALALIKQARYKRPMVYGWS